MDRNYKQRLASPAKAKQSPPRKPTEATDLYCDRHIPANTAKQLRDSFSLLSAGQAEKKTAAFENCSRSTYNQILQNELLGTQHVTSNSVITPWTAQTKTNFPQYDSVVPTTMSPSPIGQNQPSTPPRLFSYVRKQPDIDDSLYSLSPMGIRSQAILSSPKKAPRKIPKVPFKVLEAPSIQDDFYLNLVDWSSQNILSVGLHQSVYLWNASTSSVTKLCDLCGDSQVASLSWVGRGSHLAVGSTHGEITLWDITKQKQVRSFQGHKSRVGTLAWSNSPRWMLSSGSRDRSIIHHDVRTQGNIGKSLGHKQEVCGLKWGYNPTNTLASGGNDNKLLLWDQRMFGVSSETNLANAQPVHRFNSHCAAVKAITWSPHQRGLLASGGGTADQCIRFWNTGTGTELHHIDTGSQVCNLAWSKNVNELVSTHGYSQNQISVWHYPSMSEVVCLTGHSMRVLYLAVSPDGQTIVTGAGDETLRFWSLFPGRTETLAGGQQFPPSFHSQCEIR